MYHTNRGRNIFKSWEIKRLYICIKNFQTTANSSKLLISNSVSPPAWLTVWGPSGFNLLLQLSYLFAFLFIKTVLFVSMTQLWQCPLCDKPFLQVRQRPITDNSYGAPLLTYAEVYLWFLTHICPTYFMILQFLVELVTISVSFLIRRAASLVCLLELGFAYISYIDSAVEFLFHLRSLIGFYLQGYIDN